MCKGVEDKGCVIVIEGSLPTGVAANTAAIIGVTLGRLHPEAVGPDVSDGDGGAHSGIIQIPVPVLKAGAEMLAALRERAAAEESVEAVDFSDVARCCRTYAEYTERAAGAAARDFSYMGLGLFGPKKKIRSLTGSLPLFR